MHEFDVIQRYFSDILSQEDKSVLLGVGDDAAVVRTNHNEALLTSTDTLIVDVHFPENTPAYAVGFKSLAVNLSDMAAMGAKPRWCTLSISLPEAYRTDTWLQGFRDGFSALAKQHGVSLIGGDTCASAELSITIQVLGVALPEQIIYRSGAQIDDRIYVTGELGTAAYALKQLQSGEEVDSVLLNCLQQPELHTKEGLALAGKATAMLDISDGLLSDLGHILRASKAGAVIELNKVPINPILKQELAETELWQYVLSGGDDYKLCFTSTLSGPELSAQLDFPVFDIGRIVTGEGIQLIKEDGTELEIEATGFQHF